MKYIKFNDRTVNSSMYRQLQDIAHVLTDNQNFTFEQSYGHQINPQTMVISASHFWDLYEVNQRFAAYKTDVVLRALGTYHYTDLEAFLRYQKWIQKNQLRKFATSLFTLLEDLRLEDICRVERKGTVKWFKVRRELLYSYYKTQLRVNYSRQFECDALFNMIALTLLAEQPMYHFDLDGGNHLEELMERIRPILYEIYDAKNTEQISFISKRIVLIVNQALSKDIIKEYYVFPFQNITEWKLDLPSEFDELKRKDALNNDDSEDIDDEDEIINKSFSTWHRENKNEGNKQTFLRFELEQGTKTSLIGDGAREGSDQDQVAASVQGSSHKSNQQQYEQLEALEQKHTKKQDKKTTYLYGERNQFARLIHKLPEHPSDNDKKQYTAFQKEIELEVKKLRKTFEKQLEQKRTNQRSDLLYGRFSKKWLPLLTEPIPRVFFKKHQPSIELDAAFTLLIDCSASMIDKMEETKKAVILFHEVLKQLKIPHSIVGFWEDAQEATKYDQPNFYHEVLSMDECFLPSAGYCIMQLEPQEDNRDGFSIRVAAEHLEKRREKQKFLLVFSDGEPSANEYEKFGVIDTYEAVKNTRKKGIQVVGMYLANGTIEEQERELMRNIYEQEHLMIPHVNQLPMMFSVLLKKVLLTLIH